MSSSISRGSYFPLVVTHVESKCRGARCEIWVQTEMSEYDNLAALLENPPQTARITRPLRSGDIVLARYSEDGLWYRGQIFEEVSSEKGVYRLQFVDYGNVEMVDIADMVNPSRELCAIPPLGEKFILDGITPRNGCSWADSELEFLKQKLVNQEFTAEVIDKGTTGFPSTVRLSADLSAMFKPCPRRRAAYMDITREDNLPIDLCIDVELTHADSKLNFWVQRVSMKGHVEKLNEEICAEADGRFLSGLSLESIFPGVVCAAKCRSINSYARAVICDVNPSDGQCCLVTFIDYGTTEVVDVQGLRLLTPKYLEMPAQAINCSLTGECASVDSDTFSRMMTSGRLVIKVKAVMKSQRYLVQVILDALSPCIAPSPPVAVVPPAGYMNTVNCFPPGYLNMVNPLLSGFANAINPVVSGYSNMTNPIPAAYHNPVSTVMPGYGTMATSGLVGYPSIPGHFPSGYPSTTSAVLTGYPSTTSAVLTGYPNLPSAVLPGYHNTSNVDPGLTGYLSAPSMGPPGYPKATTSAQELAALMSSASMRPTAKYQPLEFDTSQHQSVCISHVDDDGTFHCQLLSNAEAINSLMMMINYSPVIPLKSVPFESMPCIVRSPYDRNLYRAKVVKQQPGSDRVIVELVDFGTKVEATVYDVHVISDAALMVPIQSITCRLYNAEDLPTEILVPLLRRYDSKAVLIARIVGKVSPYLYVLELFDTSSDEDVRLLDVAKDLAVQLTGQLNQLNKANTRASPPQSSVPPAAKVLLMTSRQLLVTTTVNAHSFIGQFYPADHLNAMQDEMHRYYASNNVPCLSNIVAGTFCCSQFMPNQRYYRAKVLRESQTQWVVEFVDSGLQEVKDRYQLKVLLPQFASLPLQSICCTLDNEYGKLTAETLNELLLKCTVMVYVVGQTDHGYVVRLVECEMNQPILQQLNRSLPKQVLECDANREIVVKLRSLQSANARADSPGFNQPLVPTGQWLPCYVSAVETPSEFYCQLSSTTSDLEVLMEEIVQHTKYTAPGHESIQKASLGLPVLAKFSADGLWYRARVTGVLKASNKVEVYFVDYGNRDTVASADIKQIPTKIMSPPEMALSCTLAGLMKEECVAWTPQETDMFSTIVEEKELKLCYMEEKDRAGHFIVHLLDEQENVNRSFLRNTRKLAAGYVSPVIKCPQFEQSESVLKSPPPATRQISGTVGGSNQSSGDGWPAKSNIDSQSGGWKQKTGDDRARDTKGGPLFQTAIRNVISEQVKDEQVQGVSVRKGEYGASSCQKDSGKSYGYLPLQRGQTFGATVSFIFHPGKFFCQNKSNKTSLDSLLEHLNAMYGNLGDGDNGFHMISLAKGQACCAKYSEDDMWYRAKVLTADSSSAATVQFVDYGNEETVALMKIRSLHEKFFHVPVQSFQCSLHGVEPVHGEWSAEALDLFEKMMADEDLLVKVIEIDTVSNGYKVEIHMGTSDVSAQARLIRAGFAKSLVTPVQERCPERGQQTNRGSSESYTPHQVLDVGKSADVYVSFVVNPGQFFCQLVQEASQLDGLMESLGNDYDGLSANELTLTRPSNGQPCCARYSEDLQWYRATVLGVENTQTKVHYIDYGNDDMVTSASVKAVKPEYMVLPPQAFECSLLGIASATHGSWSAEAVTLFTALTEAKTCRVIVRSNEKGRYEVELFVEKQDVSINSELVRRGLATDANAKRSARTDDGLSQTRTSQLESRQQAHQEPAPKSKVKYQQIRIDIGSRKKVVPSWVISPAEFYCQLADNANVIEKLQKSLFSGYHSLKPRELAVMDPHPGDACVARYEQDGNWYRGLVISVKEPVASVLYVDYGNVEAVQLTKMKHLTEQFAEIPVLALKCGLSGTEPQPKSPWSNDVLSRLADAFSKPFFVTFSKKLSDRYLVDLMAEGGRCLNNEILSEVKVSPAPLASLTYKTKVAWRPEETVEVEVVAVDEGHFFCQVVGRVDELEAVMAKLAECYEALEGEVETAELKAGQPCAAKFSEDGVWYRARIEQLAGDGQILVWFVDYGNKEMRTRTDVKLLRPQFFDLPIQALKCALARNLKAGDILMDLILGQQFKATLKKATDEILYVDLIGEDGSIVGSQSETSVPAQSIDDNSELKQNIKKPIPTNETSVCVINAMTPTEFYVQVIDREEELVAMGDKLHSEYLALSADERCMEKFDIGQLCCAKFQEDSVWYRAVIQEVEESVVKVLFVDYGNFDSVPHSDVKELHNMYREIPFFAKRCSLKGIACPTNGWGEDDTKRFADLTQAGEKVFSCVFVTAKEPFDVVLTDGDEDVSVFFPKQSVEDLAPEASASATDACTFTVYVTHVNSPSDFFMQFANNQDKLDQMTAALDDYLPDAPVLEEPTVGSMCASTYSLDDAWYRALIQETHDDGKVKVFFLDYGNTDVVDVSSLKPLNEALLAFNPFASSCCLANFPESVQLSSSSAGEIMTKVTADKEVEAHIVRQSDSKLEVTLEVDGANLLNILTEELCKSCDVQDKELSTSVPESQLARDEAVSSCELADAGVASVLEHIPQYANAFVIPGKFKVIVSSVETADSVFLQLAKDSAELESLLDLLDESYAYLKPGELDLAQEAVVGQACCASHSKVWYRATVEQIQAEGTLSLRFIDHGVVAVVRVEDVKQALPKLLEMRPLTFQCHLVGCQPERKGDTVLKDKLKEVVKDKVLTAQISVVSESLPRVLLYDKEVCLNSDVYGISADELLMEVEEAELRLNRHVTTTTESNVETELAEGVSEECPPGAVEVGKVLQVHVASASSPLDFWVTCPAETSDTDFPLLMDRIEDVYSSVQSDKHLIQKPQVGMLCVAKYSDEIWYRARILSVLENGIVQVLFIDYGNTFEVPASEVWELVTECTEPPAQAIKAFLPTIEPCDPSLGWDEASCSRFEELVTIESKPFEFHVSKVVRGDDGQLLELHGLLLDDGVDVGGELVKEGYARTVTVAAEALNSCVVVPDENDDAVGSIPVVSSDACESRQELASETNSDVVAVTGDELSPQPLEHISTHDDYANEHDSVAECTEESNAQAEEPASYPLPNESDNRCSEDSDLHAQFEVHLGYVDGRNEHESESTEVTLGSDESSSRCDEHVEQHHSPCVQQSEDAAAVDLDTVEHTDHSNESNEYVDATNRCAEESNDAVDETVNCENGATYVMTEEIDVSNAKDVCNKDEVTSFLLSADGDEMLEEVNEARQMPDSAGTEQVESACLDDTDTSSDTFHSFLELSLHKHDSLGDLTKITRTFTSDALAYPFVGLVSGDVIEVAVLSSIQGLDDIICQPVSSLDQLNVLMTSLQTSCLGEETNLEHPESSQPCAALISRDSRWYRAQVIKVVADGSLEVYCVDYGFLEHVMPEHVQLLKQEFLALPAQALHLNMTANEQEEDLSLLQTLLPGTTVMATVVQADSSNRRATVKFSMGTPTEMTYTGVLTEGTGFAVVDDISAVEFSEDLGISQCSGDGGSVTVDLGRISGNEDLSAELCDDQGKEETPVDLDHGQEEISVDHYHGQETLVDDDVKEEASVDLDHGQEEISVDRYHGQETLVDDQVKEETSVDFDHVKEEISEDHCHMQETTLDHHVKDETSGDRDHAKEGTSVDRDHVKEETSVDPDCVRENAPLDVVSVNDGACLETAIEEDLRQEATVVVSSPTAVVALQHDQHQLDLSLAENAESTCHKVPDNSSVSDSVVKSVRDRVEEYECKSVSSSNNDRVERCADVVEVAEEESCHTEDGGTHATEDKDCDFAKHPTAEEDVVQSDVSGADGGSQSLNGSSVDEVIRPAPDESDVQSSEKTSREFPADAVDPMDTRI